MHKRPLVKILVEGSVLTAVHFRYIHTYVCMSVDIYYIYRNKTSADCEIINKRCLQTYPVGVGVDLLSTHFSLKRKAAAILREPVKYSR